MVEILKYLLIVLILCLLLTGCSPTKPEAAPLKLVSSVEVDFRHRQEHLHRIYTQSDKVDVILHYLHRLIPRGTPDSDPEQLLGERCRITVRLSGGQTRTYRLQGKQYLSVDLRPWKNISRERCSVLYHLVQHMESDVIPSAAAPTAKAGSIQSERQS